MTARKQAGSKSQTLEAALATITEPKKLPPALGVAALPELVGTKRTLGPGVKEGVIRALIGARLEAGFPLVDMLREEATAESRDAFALALLAMWEQKEFHGRYIWVLDAVGALAGDRASMALAAFMAEWPSQGDSGRKRAIAAAKTLVDAGTDTAILELLDLRQTAVVPTVLEAIIEAVDRAVAFRNTTLSELFDVVTPTLGLDQRGTRTFEHEGRVLIVTFDDHLEPRLMDADVPIDTLDHVPAWVTLSAQLRDAVKVQTFRLEHDMVSGRRWDVRTWTRCLNEHPLLVTFTQRLVWGIYDEAGKLGVTFRSTEDRSLVSRDAEIKLPRDARIGLVHALHLPDAERDAWATHLAEYEIIQPFPQLGRSIFRVAPEEAAATATSRFASTHFKSGVLRDVLVRIGWQRDTAFLRKEYQRVFPTVVAIAEMDPGVQAGSASYDAFDQTIATVEFRLRKGRGKSTTPMTLSDVPAVTFSEAMLDITQAHSDIQG
jgi:hypothetical protein